MDGIPRFGWNRQNGKYPDPNSRFRLVGQIGRNCLNPVGKPDGTGYPDGLSGEEIPLCARIMALADVFDALYQDRCYKKAIRPASKVFEIIKENSGSQFDPNLTEIFLELQREITDISE